MYFKSHFKMFLITIVNLVIEAGRLNVMLTSLTQTRESFGNTRCVSWVEVNRKR